MLIGLLVSVALAAVVIFILPALAKHGRRPVLDLTDPEQSRRRRRAWLHFLLAFLFFYEVDSVQTILGGRPSGAAAIALALVLIVALGLYVVMLFTYPRRH